MHTPSKPARPVLRATCLLVLMAFILPVSGAGPAPGPSTSEPGFLSSTAALSFDGADDHVTMGAAPSLNAAAFTIECWFRMDGAGTTANTGSGGFQAVPLLAKGRGESDGGVVDMNYFLGILTPGNVLAADFEEHTSGATPGLNHPATGSTAITTSAWHHAAATYDGTCWELYLDGIPQTGGANCPAQPPNFVSTQHFALGTAMNSSGTAEGRFEGVIDEVRVWDHARTRAQINTDINSEIAAAPGLIGRWGLDENSGTNASDSAGASTGTIVGATWISPGAPLDLDRAPETPVLVSPPDAASGVELPPSLSVSVSDIDADPLDVSFHGREVTAPTQPDFTIVALPDTQYYSCGASCGSDPNLAQAQTQWIVDNLDALNIAFVTQLGDCVEHGDTYIQEWINAENAFELLEDPLTTGLTDGIPYGIAVGNHDQSPIGDPAGTTTYFNQFFGESRFLGRGYYMGHQGANNDNHVEFFSVSGMDFMVIHLEYDATPAPGNTTVLAWAEGLLQANPSRRAIVVSHSIIGTGNPGAFSTQGQNIYDALKDNPNLFLMLAGHVPGEGRRSDTFAGKTVHTLLADYQGRANGGNGWLRILEFSPSNNEIRVRTYSPWLDQFETDGDSQFTVSYDMGGGAGPFQPIGTDTAVPSGGQATVLWSGLDTGATYEWYAEASDGTSTTAGPVWSFGTECQDDAECDDSDPCTVDSCDPGTGACQNVPIEPCCQSDAECDDGEPCTDDSCDIVAHTCSNDPLADDTPCEDGTACTTGEVCAAGTCGGGTLIPGCCAVDADCADGNACTIDICPAAGNTAALVFDGIDDQVSMGPADGATGLNAATFTIETWFRWESGGSVVSTGTGGINAYPLVTKGRGEAESATLNLNYFLGILATGELAADFEEHSSGTTVGLNHPVIGGTALTASDGLWHHAAATYDGICWRLYLDGEPDTDGTDCPAEPPAFDSIQHFGLGTAFNSSGGASGRLAGMLDEVRVWNRALSHSEIRARMGRAMPSDPDLLGRWGLDEGVSSVAGDSTGHGNTGAVSGASWTTTGLVDFGVENVCENAPVPACCEDAADCDDAEACTVDSCIDNTCSHEPDPGCCMTDPDCDDTDACTTDQCVAGACVNDPIAGCCMDVLDCGDADACTTDSCLGVNTGALGFDGTDDQVAMGPAAGVTGLNAATFTVETWFRWETGGSTASTGTGGINAYPLVTKGRGESEAATLNLNYFLGILSTGQLAADFEEHSTGATVGLNHPVTGTTALTAGDGQWHHAAATYDGSCWQLYLDGDADTPGTLCPGQPPDFDSVQHFGLGTAFTSGGAASGRFSGALDEVRVWNRALSPTEIQAGMNTAIESHPDLLGRWSFDEGGGNGALDSTGRGNNGVLSGGAWTESGLTDLGSGWCVNEAQPGCCDGAGDCDDLLSCTADSCALLPSSGAMLFDGVDDRVSMGVAPGLGAASFTLEMWFRKDGNGTTAGTGTGGITAVPLISKGRAEADGSRVDMAYFLGISGGALAADFEDTATGLNHPVCGTAAVTDGEWHHAAASYDGTCWQLYLDGAPIGMDTACSTCSGGACTVCPGATPRLDSLGHFSIGAALNSTGVPAGAFAGAIDEARVWSFARSAAQIAEARDRRISSATGLLGRWGFDDMTANDTSGHGWHGTATGAFVVDTDLIGFFECGHAALPDGSPCDDGIACTTGATCASMVCGGGTSVPLGDTLLLEHVAPATAALTWTPLPDVTGYNVYRGTRDGAWSYDHVCLVGGVAGVQLEDSEMPALGTVSYYLITCMCGNEESIPGLDSGGVTLPLPSPCP